MMCGVGLQICETADGYHADLLTIQLHPRDREVYALGLHATQVVALGGLDLDRPFT
ncbi:hypothetical protein [Glutamicibacter sp.]|uniref:hypothetical protein n=1 Tax=Glutamicibacter sp. TaxID=1931995 RepID=UPI002FE3F71A